MQLDKPYKTPFIGEKSHMDKIGRKKSRQTHVRYFLWATDDKMFDIDMATRPRNIYGRLPSMTNIT